MMKDERSPVLTTSRTLVRLTHDGHLLCLFVFEALTGSNSSSGPQPDPLVISHLRAVRNDEALRIPPAAPVEKARPFQYLACTSALSDHEPAVGIQYSSTHSFDWDEVRDFYRPRLQRLGWEFTGSNAVGRLDFFHKAFPDWEGRLSLFLARDGRVLEISIEQVDRTTCGVKATPTT
ncbi:MAG: hypothetical protein LC808_27535 [Actinobacteria bacterium]|nr:hypothetical protein [Actinomycetota bacterium]